MNREKSILDRLEKNEEFVTKSLIDIEKANDKSEVITSLKKPVKYVVKEENSPPPPKKQVDQKVVTPEKPKNTDQDESKVFNEIKQLSDIKSCK